MLFPPLSSLIMDPLPVTSVGYSVLSGPSYLKNILLTPPHITANLIFVWRFTTDNHCSMEFDLIGLSVKDLFPGT
jgi:hypothetical protein